MGGTACLVYHEGYLGYDFGPGHPMRQVRILLTHRLMEALGLIGPSGVKEWRPDPAPFEAIKAAHEGAYIEVVRRMGAPGATLDPEVLGYGLGTGDNPIFEGMYDAAILHTGGTVLCGDLVRNGKVDHAFSPGGGFHHAMHSRASGFCIFNDPVAAIRRVVDHGGLRRVLYVDIDAHHGDGVQAAFYSDPRVMTVSLHEDGRYLFPGTGFVEEIGEGEGEGYSVNVPLPPYTGDDDYLEALEAIVPPLAKAFRADLLFTQMGMDTHYTDPLTHLKLTTGGYKRIFRLLHSVAHADCGGRWVGVGGGGYDPSAVARAWTLVLGEMVGRPLEGRLPGPWVEEARRLTGEPPGKDLDDPGGHETKSRSGVQGVIGEVKRRIFPYHGL